MFKTVSWSQTNPVVFNHTEEMTETHYQSIGSGIEIPTSGVAVQIVGTKYKCWFHISPPGVYPLYFAVLGSTIHLSNFKRDLVARVGVRAKIEQAQCGVVYVFDKVLKKYKGQQVPIPTETMNVVADDFLEVLLIATKDIYTRMGSPRVLTSISGGTDGILTAYLLKEIGADQLCVCVGRDGEDFDPKNARIYAKHLGLRYEFLPLPSEDDRLQALLDETVRSIEMTDFSNVLMGMCNVLVRNHAITHGIDVHFNADFADVVLGNDILTVGKYNKQCNAAGVEPSRMSWAKFRVDAGLHTLPTNIQIAKVFMASGVLVRQVFYHPLVVEFLLGCPLELTPNQKDKVLYKHVLKTAFPDVPWSFEKKIGYYTGAGIGKIRLENPILSDENIRATYKRVKGA